jgi:hypothetical protein
MSSFFKKLGRDISSTFKKAPQAINSVFKKGGQISRVVSKGLGATSKILGTIGKGIGSVVNSPVAQGIAMAVAPELAPELIIGGKALSKGLQVGSKVAGAGSRLTDVDSYKKSHLENVSDALKRADELKGATQDFA